MRLICGHVRLEIRSVKSKPSCWCRVFYKIIYMFFVADTTLQSDGESAESILPVADAAGGPAAVYM